MSRSVISSRVSPSRVAPARAPDWDRLWRHCPGETQDDALIARERGSQRWASIHERLEEVFGSTRGLRTVELGSGRGDLSALLAEAGARVTLLDSSAAALSQARLRFARLGLPATYEQGDIFETHQAWRGSFDVALSSGVIEHFHGEQRTRIVRIHYDILEPGGLAIISVPNAWCIPYRVWKFYLELRRWWPYGLEIPYTRSELVQRARAAGFSRVEARCMGLWQSVSAHLMRGLLGLNVDWSRRSSFLDRTMGSTLLVFGRRAG